MRQILAVGDTGTQLVSKFNLIRGELFDVTAYGALGDNSSNDTAAIQSCINDAYVSTYGGIIYFPPGIYLSNTLTFYETTPILGAGYNLSQIKSIASEPLISMKRDNTWTWGFYMNKIKLNGNNIGTIGFDTKLMAFFTINNCWVQNFTNCGVYLLGSENGTFYDCFFAACNKGISAFGMTLATYPIKSMANEIKFYRCYVISCPKYGIEWIGGNPCLDACHIEANGTLDDLTTGGVYINNTDGYDPNVWISGGIFKDTSFESNLGISLNLDESISYKCTHIFEHSGILPAEGQVSIQLKGVTVKNKLILKDSIILGNTDCTLNMIGSNSIVINEGTMLEGGLQNNDNGLYTVIYDEDGIKP